MLDGLSGDDCCSQLMFSSGTQAKGAMGPHEGKTNGTMLPTDCDLLYGTDLTSIWYAADELI